MTRYITEREAQDRLEHRTGQTAIYVGATIAGHRFRVSRGGAATEVIVPKAATETHWKGIEKALELYFSFFGKGDSAPYKDVKDAPSQD